MNCLNSICIEGVSVGTPVLETNVHKKCTMTLAVSRAYRDSKGQTMIETDNFEIKALGMTAEDCSRYATEGRMVRAVGRVANERSVIDGKKTSRVVIIAEHVDFR